MFAFTEEFVARIMDERKGNKRGKDKRGRGGQGRGGRRDEGGGGGGGTSSRGGGTPSRGGGTPGRGGGGTPNRGGTPHIGGTPSRGGGGGGTPGRGRGRGGGQGQGREGMVPMNQFEHYLPPEEVQRGLHDGEELAENHRNATNDDDGINAVVDILKLCSFHFPPGLFAINLIVGWQCDVIVSSGI